jgi:hypothetical protein
MQQQGSCIPVTSQCLDDRHSAVFDGPAGCTTRVICRPHLTAAVLATAAAAVGYHPGYPESEPPARLYNSAPRQYSSSGGWVGWGGASPGCTDSIYPISTRGVHLWAPMHS